MKKIEFTITDELGVHARPAGALVKEASKFSSDLKIIKGDKSADLKRLFALMGMNIKKGDTITVEVNGIDEEEAIESISSFLKSNL